MSCTSPLRRIDLYAAQGRASANDYAAQARAFQADADWSATYNHTLAGGKWDHMMDQTHIGYTVMERTAREYLAGGEGAAIVHTSADGRGHRGFCFQLASGFRGARSPDLGCV